MKTPNSGHCPRGACITLAGSVLAGIMLLGGCSSLPLDAFTSDTLARYDGTGRTAKTALIEYTKTLDDVMALVEPGEIIAPLPPGSRYREQLRCQEDHIRFMIFESHGGVLAPSANSEAILERIAQDYEERTHWIVERVMDDTTNVLVLVVLENDNGMSMYAHRHIDTSQAQLRTIGYTACFAPSRVAVDDAA